MVLGFARRQAPQQTKKAADVSGKCDLPSVPGPALLPSSFLTQNFISTWLARRRRAGEQAQCLSNSPAQEAQEGQGQPLAVAGETDTLRKGVNMSVGTTSAPYMGSICCYTLLDKANGTQHFRLDRRPGVASSWMLWCAESSRINFRPTYQEFTLNYEAHYWIYHVIFSAAAQPVLPIFIFVILTTYFLSQLFVKAILFNLNE